MVFTYVLGDSCNVYSASASSGCHQAYYLSMVGFCVIVVPLVLMELGDQAKIQTFMTGYRVLALFVMLLTICIKLGTDGGQTVSDRLTARPNLAFNFKNFDNGFGSTLLALSAQANMPDALQPLHHDQKLSASRVVMIAMWIVGILYLLLGVLGAIAFDDVNQLATLMWSDFTGCGNGWSSCPSGKTNAIGVIVYWIVLLFPVVNIVSCYPMIGVTVGDNILPSFPESLTAKYGRRTARNISRLLAAIPPLVLASIFKQLESIFSICGILGFILGLIIPCWFQVSSIQYCRRVYGTIESAVTPYSSRLVSSLHFSFTCLIGTIIITLIALYSLIPGGF
jgi:amino acid permease